MAVRNSRVGRLATGQWTASRQLEISHPSAVWISLWTPRRIRNSELSGFTVLPEWKSGVGRGHLEREIVNVAADGPKRRSSEQLSQAVKLTSNKRARYRWYLTLVAVPMQGSQIGRAPDGSQQRAKSPLFVQTVMKDAASFPKLEEANSKCQQLRIYWVSWHLSNDDSKRHADRRSLGEEQSGLDLAVDQGWK